MNTLEILEDLRNIFGPVLIDPRAPWGGDLDEWTAYFTNKLGPEVETPSDILELNVLLAEASGLRWVRKKFGSAKARAHRDFLKMVRADPSAHRRKMRTDRIYRRHHLAHDKLMRRTARKGQRREEIEEREVGQAFMDLPFELRVTSGSQTETDLTDKEREQAAKAASKKSRIAVPTHYIKDVCSMEAFYKNVQYFYRVKGLEIPGSKQEKLQRAIAASYSALRKACGVKGNGRLTPSEIVAQGAS